MGEKRDHSGNKHFGFVRDHKEDPQGSRYSLAEEERRKVAEECSLMRTERELRKAAEERRQ